MSPTPLYRIRRKARTSPAHTNTTKRTIKFLATSSDPRIQRIVLNSATDSVYKSICNAFFNIAENPDIQLSPKHRRLIRHHRPRIRKLLSNTLPIAKKRRVIQKGGAAFLGTILPIVLSSALSLLGTKFL